MPNHSLRRIIMPLFQFQYTDDQEFVFSDSRFGLRRFNAKEYLIDCDFFSGQDSRYMHKARWALVATLNDFSDYEEDVSLLLMSFRLLSNKLSPFIKYRISADLAECRILTEVATQHIPSPKRYEVYKIKQIEEVDTAYTTLLEADKTSLRLKNAIYFLYVGFHSRRWIEAFLTLMMSLEALFSKDSHGGATSTICRRVSNFISDTSICTKDEMLGLYDIRSRMAHGNLQAGKSEENLKHLKRLENITVECFRKMMRGDMFKSYKTKPERDRFVSLWD